MLVGKKIGVYGIVFLVLLGIFGSSLTRAQDIEVPQFLNPNTIAPSVSAANIRTIRFITTNDFPPFNFVSQRGELEGFNVALARAICFEIKARCTMQVVAWGKMDESLENGQGDAIIAGIRISEETLEKYTFTKPYLRFPARFFTTKDRAGRSDTWTDFRPFTIGVEANTAHEAYLKDVFMDLNIVPLESQAALREAVLDGTVEVGFGDGIGTSFWFQSVNANGCCQFVGGAYLSTDYFGTGMAIAVPKDREGLREAIDGGLRRVVLDRKFREIYLRYFPIDFFAPS